MRARQRGVTFIGWLLLLLPLAVVFYAGVRLAPVYLNYMKVAHSLDALKSELATESSTLSSLNISLQKEFDIQSIDYPTVKDINITRQGRAWVVDASYDDQAPLFANISIQVAFHKVVEIGGATAGE
jgi:hypothetical protein